MLGDDVDPHEDEVRHSAHEAASDDDPIRDGGARLGAAWAGVEMPKPSATGTLTTLLDEVGLGNAITSLDVGCGGSGVMRLMAERLGAGSRVTGVDVDAPLGAEVLTRLRDELAADSTSSPTTSARSPCRRTALISRSPASPWSTSIIR